MNKLSPGSERIRAELVARELRRRRLIEFVKYFHGSYMPGWVHYDICSRLEQFSRDVANKKSPRLMLLMPPRAGKSEIISKMYPGWHLGQYPDHEFIGTSYNISLATEFSRKIRDIVKSEEYQAMYPETKLHPDFQGAEAWRLHKKQGGYVAAGIGGGITGKGAHCVVPYCEVSTHRGLFTAGELLSLIKNGQEVPLVLSFNHRTGLVEPRRIERAYERTSNHVYEISFANGSVLTATGEHPICIDKECSPPKFRRLDDLRLGEAVVSLRSPCTERGEGIRAVPDVRRNIHKSAGEVSGSEKSQRGFDAHLFEQVLRDAQSPANKAGGNLWDMWGSFRSSAVALTRGARVLLERMLWKASVEDVCRERAPEVHGGDPNMHPLQQGVSTQTIARYGSKDAKTVLLPDVLPPSYAWSAYEEGRRTNFAEVLRPRIQTSQSADESTEQSVCFVWENRDDPTPRGREQREQRPPQPASSVRSVPYTPPHTLTYTSVVGIKRIDQPATVIDFEIAGTHNFIADNSLLLNCLLIDDPVKSHEEADSETIRESIWNWYTSTAYTRLAPGGGVLLVQTAWHDDDLQGHLQRAMKEDPEFDQFEVIKYPAIAEFDEYSSNPELARFAKGTNEKGEFLLRKKDEALHPARYDEKQLHSIKKTLGPRHWSALYQQNPVPDDGNYFNKDYFIYRDPPWAKATVYQAWDFAISEKQQNDYTVGSCAYHDESDVLFIADLIRFKSGNAFEIVEAMINFALKHSTEGEYPLIGVEDGQIWKSLSKVFEKRCQERGVYLSVEVMKPLTDKLVRARPLQGRMQQHMVAFPMNTEWVTTVLNEMLRFPSGLHDDIVDSLAWLAQLCVGKTPPRHAAPKKVKSWKDKLSGIGLGSRSHMSS